jgi:hypothetical protein
MASLRSNFANCMQCDESVFKASNICGVCRKVIPVEVMYTKNAYEIYNL